MIFRDDALAGQHIVISGGCGAIGLGVVKKLTDHGACLTVNDIVDAGEAQKRLADINAEKIQYVKGDLTHLSDIENLVKTARAKFGAIHTALCHIGMVMSGPLLEITPNQWDQTMAVNVKTAFLLGQAAARSMLEERVAGHLIFTTSWVAETPWPEIGPYNASKAIPLGHMQPLDSVSDAFLFLCTSAASYMTGSVLTVDGGCSLYPMD
jgi:NAD(P)-dependent dehydrogenase (short-subunit alcohol dehydrogenase family)